MPVSKSNLLRKEMAFYKSLLENLPAIIFVYQYEKPGIQDSCRITWMNQKGLDHFRLSLSKINHLGNDFFKQVLNSENIRKYNPDLEKSYDLSANFVMMGIFNIKSSEKCQSFTYNPYNVLEYFDNGMPKTVLCTAFELKENNNQCRNQMTFVLNEINNINARLNNSNFTKREKQILALIVKGKTDKDISNELFISAETAKKHRHNLKKNQE